MHIFMSVGEPSGDQHAAELMSEFSQRVPGTRFSGFGGPDMQTQGLDCLYPLTDLAVMGIGQVLPQIRKFYGLYQQAKEFLHREKPEAVVLVDYPGFNWWVAKAAKSAGIPVYYYCPPQLWAWAPWRIRKVRKFVDCILSVLPFEAEWYRNRGVDVEYVGHPFFDEVAAHSFSPNQLSIYRSADCQTIAILPGSRKQEVLKNFPVMIDTMQKLYEKHPRLRFDVACYKQWHHENCERMLAESGAKLPVTLHVGKTSQVIEAADLCLIVSGSVSLEVLARKKPAVIMYRGSPLMYVLCHSLMTIDYFSLPNLIADGPLMPEFPLVLRSSWRVDRMTSVLDEWLSNPDILEERRQAVADLAESIVEVGGVKRAAEVLVRRLTQQQEESEPIQKRAA